MQTIQQRAIPSPTFKHRANFDVNSDPQNDERACQLADIAASGDEDNAECAAADLFREFPPAL